MSLLVVATQNRGKTKEIARALPGLTIQTLADYPQIQMPPEDAATFSGNALLKAKYVADLLGLPVLADDSGLVVDALGGAPGVHSARYALGSDQDRYEKLLMALQDVPEPRRTARFVCAMALLIPNQDPIQVEGVVEGRIARAPQGDGGFGYDPIFLVGDGSRTMAELSPAEKGAVSHRGRALEQLWSILATHFSLEQ